MGRPVLSPITSNVAFYSIGINTDAEKIQKSNQCILLLSLNHAVDKWAAQQSTTSQTLSLKLFFLFFFLDLACLNMLAELVELSILFTAKFGPILLKIPATATGTHNSA